MWVFELADSDQELGRERQVEDFTCSRRLCEVLLQFRTKDMSLACRGQRGPEFVSASSSTGFLPTLGRIDLVGKW